MLDLDAVVEALLARPDLLARLRAELGVGEADLVTIGRAAEMLGISPKTVRNWLADGRLKPYGAPRRRLVSVAEINGLRGVGAVRTFKERARHE